METQDPLISCPYNLSHQILTSRMQFHLTKCRRNHPGTDTEICPFNATHHIPKPELPFHMTVCSNRKVFENALYVTTDSTERADLPRYQQAKLPVYSENWDDDLVTCSYQPSEKAAEAPVLRQLIGATKSERKKFRLKERRRVQDLKEKGHCDVREDTSTLPSTPLRLPNNFVPASSNPNMGLGRGTSRRSDDGPLEGSNDVGNPPSSSVRQLTNFVPATDNNPNTALGQSEDGPLNDAIAQFNNLSMSRGRGGVLSRNRV